jgi:predicted transcriptional regulator
LWEWE